MHPACRAASVLLLASSAALAQTTGTSKVWLPAPFSCGTLTPANFLDTAERFELTQLAFNPVEATQAGYHAHDGKSLDTLLDDGSAETIRAEHQLFEEGQRCFASSAGKLGPEDAADMALLRDSIESSLFQLDRLQSYKFQPQGYVEMIGSGLFYPLTETRGDREQRLADVLSRMERIPQVLDEAKAALVSADPVFIDTAIDENSGNVELVQQVAESIPGGSPLRGRYDAASKPALAALNAFSDWLKSDLAKRPLTRTWRTGATDYARIFSYALGPGTNTTPQVVLNSAERDLGAIREQMYALALPLHAKWFPDHGDHHDLSGDALQNRIIAEVIDRINDDHVKPGELLEEVESQAAGIQAFIREHDLVTLSSRDNLKIVPTPEFLRGIYSVAGFHSAPALDPEGEAEYWVTPIGADTPAAKAESKLREYNNWMLQYLTMHEALPGHYTQFEHANNIPLHSRRILRALLGSGAYAEGWGEYGVKEMEDAGYANNDPRFVLMVLKIRLRVVANAILDIRMQSMNMTDAEALDLMEHRAFQTHAEAMGKLRRAKLSSGQLITYYVGFHQWIDLRGRYEKAAGSSFRLKDFNDAALDEGPLPMPLLGPLMLARIRNQQ
ncbi:MAG TPA: DUF885 domain-containing protein [Acidisarcina sp.]